MQPEIKQKILTWCQQARIFQEEVEDQSVQFRLRVRAPSVPAKQVGEYTIDVLDIVRPKENGDSLIVTSGIEFDEAFAAPMKSFPGAEDILFNLEMILDGRDELYLVDTRDGVLRSIIIFEEIFDDGLTKDRLMRALRGVNKTLVVALWVIRDLISALGASPEQMVGMDEKTSISPSVMEAGPEVTLVRCPACGMINEAKHSFCTQCGSKLRTASSKA